MTVPLDPTLEEEDDDEYEQFYDPLDIEDILNTSEHPIPPGPPDHPDSQEDTPAPVLEHSQAISDSNSNDEYDKYDFSEFTAEDFASIDAAVLSAFEIIPTPADAVPSANTNGTNAEAGPSSNGPHWDIFGGPAVAISIEESADSSGIVKEPDLPPVIEKPIAAEPKSEPWKRKGPSPYDRFRSYRGFLAVTDLVSPSW